MKSIGDMGSPCLRPCSILNSLDGLPFMSTEGRAVDKIAWIHVVHFEPNSKWCIVFSRNFQLTVSNAFSKSNLSMRPLVCLFCMLCTTSFAIRIESVICLPLMNADCSSAISPGRRILSLFASILSMIFIVELMRLIGL